MAGSGNSQVSNRVLGETQCYDKLLGKGGYSSVFEGLCHKRRVAVKRILSEDYQDVEEELLKFSHPYLVKYLAIWKEVENFVYITMEFCAGTLKQVTSGTYNGPSPGPMEELVLQTALGLEYLHSKDIVHRDIKPENILISAVDITDDDGQQCRSVPKLADSSVKKKQADASSFSKSRSGIGTPGWAAPECINENIAKVKFSADVFSLGCVIGYALTQGNHPYGDGYARADKILKGTIDWKNEHLIGNKEIESMVKDMVSEDPDKRPLLGDVIKQLHLAWVQHVKQTLPLEEEQKKSLEDLQTVVRSGFNLDIANDNGSNFLTLLFKSFAKKRRLQSTNEIKNYSLKLFKRDDSENERINIFWQRNILYILLSNAASTLIRQKDKEGRNVLHHLCEGYSSDDIADIARLMIDRGINVDETDKSGRIPLHYLWNNKNRSCKDLIKLLSEQSAGVGIKTIDGETFLHLLASNYEGSDICDVMRLLIGAGSDVNQKTGYGRNVLVGLCRDNTNHEMLREAIDLLIRNKVDVQSVYLNGDNALTYISWFSKRENAHESAKLLIDSGINVNQVNSNGWNALMLVCRNGTKENQYEIAKLLIEKGINVNQVDKKGGNALMRICHSDTKENQYEMAKLLIEKEINVNQVSKDGWNALMLVCRHGTKENQYEMAKLLIEKEINVNQVSKSGLNALIVVCYGEEKKTHKIVKLLIAAKINVNQKIATYDSLHFLCENYKGGDLVEIIQTLLNNGSDINSRSKFGSNALLLLCEFCDHSRLKSAASLLVERGIDVTAKDADGHDAIYYLRNRETQQPREIEEVERLLRLRLAV